LPPRLHRLLKPFARVKREDLPETFNSNAIVKLTRSPAASTSLASFDRGRNCSRTSEILLECCHFSSSTRSSHMAWSLRVSGVWRGFPRRTACISGVPSTYLVFFTALPQLLPRAYSCIVSSITARLVHLRSLLVLADAIQAATSSCRQSFYSIRVHVPYRGGATAWAGTASARPGTSQTAGTAFFPHHRAGWQLQSIVLRKGDLLALGRLGLCPGDQIPRPAFQAK